MSENTLNTNNNDNFNISNDLEWNKKKQDMIINLGLTTNHVETDQTPTPTRFIRNCEKVGLFQDLQHVNPFDEEFAKAIQNSNQLNVHTTLNDSLHTPQPEIYEQIQNSSKYNIENNNKYREYNNNEEEEETPLIIVVKDSENKHLKEEKNNQIIIKEKIKHTILKHQKVIVPQIKITHLNNNNNNNTKEEDIINKEKKLMQKEALRAAQNRCRKRKQRLFEEMKQENQFLKVKNAKLEQENFNLENKLQELETQLKAFHNSSNNNSSTASVSATVKHNIIKTNNNIRGEIGEILKPIAPKYSSILPATEKINKNPKNTFLFVYPPQIIVTTPREEQGERNYFTNMKSES